jgi:hypothetical protein
MRKRQMIIILIIVILITICFAVFVLYQKSKYSSFVEVNAKIVDYSEKSRSLSVSSAYYVVYEFEYMSNLYYAERQVFAKSDENIGRIDVIRCNPNNPKELENTLNINTCMVVIAFLCVLSFLMLLIILRKR